MKILSVDTSCITAAIAIIEGDKLLGEYITNHKKTHSQKLMPMVDQLLKSLDMKIEDIDVFAAATGPGSFTGLRIGVVSIKGLAYALGKPAISIPTLDAMAYSLPYTPFIICPIIDARNRQVYTALYQYLSEPDGKDSFKRISEYNAFSVDELIPLINSKGTKAIFTGDAVPLYKELLSSQLTNGATFVDTSITTNRAAAIAKLALKNYKNDDIMSAYTMTPFYLRQSQAERMKNKSVNQN